MPKTCMHGRVKWERGQLSDEFMNAWYEKVEKIRSRRMEPCKQILLPVVYQRRPVRLIET